MGNFSLCSYTPWVVGILLEAGANPYALDRNRQTPAEVANLRARDVIEAWQEGQLQEEKGAGRRNFMAARRSELERRANRLPIRLEPMELIADYVTPADVIYTPGTPYVLDTPGLDADRPTRQRYITEQVETADRRAIEQEQERHRRQIEEARRMWMEVHQAPAPAPAQ